MERLTRKTNDGRTVFAGEGTPTENALKLPGVLNRLAAYEETGLEPEEVEALKVRALRGVLESPELAEYSGSALERADGLIADLERELSSYRATGLEPDQVKAYADCKMGPATLTAIMHADCLGKFAAWEEADRDGRLVVLSEPMLPLICSDDEHDTDVYCPKCGETLSDGWDDADPDDTRKLCQCWHCGQSIDDTKLISRAEAEAALRGEDHG